MIFHYAAAVGKAHLRVDHRFGVISPGRRASSFQILCHSRCSQGTSHLLRNGVTRRSIPHVRAMRIFGTYDQHIKVGIAQKYKIITEKIRDGVYAKDRRWTLEARRKGMRCSQVTRETPERQPPIVHHPTTQEIVHPMPFSIHPTSSGEVTIIVASGWGSVPTQHP